LLEHELTNDQLFFRKRLTLTAFFYIKIDTLQCLPDRISVYGGYTSSYPHFLVQILFSVIIRILLSSFCKRSNIYPEIDFTAKLYDLRFEIWE
jgi:hypothetical protein